MRCDRKGVQYLRSTGGSALLDAVEATAEYLQKNAHYSRRVIVLVSDGGDNASKHNAAQVWDVLHRPEAPVVYSIANWSPALSGTQADESRLRKLTEATGGLEFRVKKDDQAVEAADHLMEAMDGRYELEFTASDPATNGSERKLRVKAGKELRAQKMKVVGPDGYLAARQ